MSVGAAEDTGRRKLLVRCVTLLFEANGILYFSLRFGWRSARLPGTSVQSPFQCGRNSMKILLP
jgi:hypothetical protein